MPRLRRATAARIGAVAAAAALAVAGIVSATGSATAGPGAQAPLATKGEELRQQDGATADALAAGMMAAAMQAYGGAY